MSQSVDIKNFENSKLPDFTSTNQSNHALPKLFESFDSKDPRESLNNSALNTTFKSIDFSNRATPLLSPNAQTMVDRLKENQKYYKEQKNKQIKLDFESFDSKISDSK